MIVIPSIELRSGRAARTLADDERTLPSDPVELAVQWRRENARVLHLLDADAMAGTGANDPAVRAVAAAVDIPVQLVARFESIEECEMWLRSGVYRIAVHGLLVRDPAGVKKLVERFGPSRIVAGALTRGAKLAPVCDGDKMPVLEFCANARRAGMHRTVAIDLDREGGLRGPNYDELEEIARSSGMRVTAGGGIGQVEHLWRLQELVPAGVDSVVIGRALYDDRFPCQALWRKMETERQSGGSADGVSTAPLRSGEEARSEK